ncbi:MAG: DJ-1/PfpI family protein [Synergistaceae bacterium]|nr:DJ-1/PfpI family protein [Synergistaceae bacterium]
MNIAVILAGGIGSRVGAGIPKQFIEVLGKPILAYTIDVFDKHPDIDAVLVVCVKPYIPDVWAIKEKYSFSRLMWVTEGGATFQDSVLNGINFLKGKISDKDTVLFHFGASPFVTPEIITDAIRVCKGNGSNAISSTDYLLLSGIKHSAVSVSDPDNYTDTYIDRDTIAVMNTPHAFKYGFIAGMYSEAVETGIISRVEAHTTALMQAMGKRIYFSRGSQTNIKITTKDDLRLFEGYVLEQQRTAGIQANGDVIVFLADGFEECEGLLVVDILRRAGLRVIMASVMGRRDVKSSRGILITADCLAENADYAQAKMIVLPGGRIGTKNLAASEIVRSKCREFAAEKMIAAICAAPSILAELGLLDGKKATCHFDFEAKMSGALLTGDSVTVDGNIVTGQGLGAGVEFAFELVRILAGEEKVRQIKHAICYE